MTVLFNRSVINEASKYRGRVIIDRSVLPFAEHTPMSEHDRRVWSVAYDVLTTILPDFVTTQETLNKVRANYAHTQRARKSLPNRKKVTWYGDTVRKKELVHDLRETGQVLQSSIDILEARLIEPDLKEQEIQRWVNNIAPYVRGDNERYGLLIAKALATHQPTTICASGKRTQPFLEEVAKAYPVQVKDITLVFPRTQSAGVCCGELLVPQDASVRYH